MAWLKIKYALMRKSSTHTITQSSVQNRDRRTSGKVLILLMVLMAFFAVQMDAQCPLICNKNVNISMDDDCEITITPDVMLEGDGLLQDCYYEVVIMGSNNVPIPGSPNLNHTHVGKTFNVKIISDHNECWGKLTVEDKTPPTIICPDPITISCYDKRTFQLPLAIDNCGENNTVKEISNDVEDIGCSTAFSAIRRITYQATDKSGNVSPICTRVVYYRKVGLDEIMFPLNRDNIEDGALDCANKENWDKNGNKYPDISETGIPKTMDGFPIFPNTSFCELNSTYVDHQILICGASKKIFRTWTVMDWCTSELATDIQVIKITDDEGPTGVISIDSLIVPADGYTCLANWMVPAPTNVMDCSEHFYSVAYVVADKWGNFPVDPIYSTVGVVKMGEKYTINGLPVGKVRIRYKLEDVCGNFTYKFGDIIVADKTAPNVICDEHTIVTLNNNGVGSLDAITLDDGSFDRCTDIEFDARRMTAACGYNNTEWVKRVYFCCADVGKEIMVALRVTDKYGNFNTCMVTVRVQDKINPKITCPPDITVDCGTDLEDYDVVGKATAVDNCANPMIYKRDSSIVNQCGIGVIKRKWFAEDKDGRKDSCVQMITVLGLDPLDYDDIIWQTVRDTIINGCMDIDTDPAYTGRPKWEADSCRLIGSQYKDHVFTQVEGVCFKILRTWTIIDWCNYNQQYPERYKYTHVQVIKITNNQKPVFDNCRDTTFCTYEANCYGFIQFKGKAKDDCTPEKDLHWKFEIDLNNNGTIDTMGIGNDISGLYTVGRHKVIWLVTDGCGNTSKCEQIFYVKDCKKPTPYCFAEIQTVIMPSGGFIDIWAKDFDKGSFDNCGGKLRFSFSQDPRDTGRRFTCDEVGLNSLQMWVTDTTGNQDYCLVKIDIQDNGNSCNGGHSGNKIVKGSVSSENGFVIKDVELSLQNMDSKSMKYTRSDNSTGGFAFENLETANYMLQATKKDEQMMGINTIDLVKIQRHILAMTKLDGPYKILAADVTQDQKVSVDDIVSLRKLILGVDRTFPKGSGWLFIPENTQFADQQKPWPISTEWYIKDFAKPANFKAIKLGDVDGSGFRSVNNLTTRYSAYKSLEIQADVSRENTTTLTIRLKEKQELMAMQFELKLPEHVKISDIKKLDLPVISDMVTYNPARHALSFAFHSAHGDALLVKELFSIEVDGMIEADRIALEDERIDAMIYNGQEVFALMLSDRSALSDGFVVKQNEPNPFYDKTNIRIHVPESGKSELKMYDITGKLLIKRSIQCQQGWNEVQLSKDEISVKGLIYYEVEYEGIRSVKKMLIL